MTIVEDIAEVRLQRSYDLTAPQGVRGRNSDNELISRLLSWSPSTPLADGLRATYEWIHGQIPAGLSPASEHDGNRNVCPSLREEFDLRR